MKGMLLVVLVAVFLLNFSGNLFAADPRIQAIQGMADPALDSVDVVVWVDLGVLGKIKYEDPGLQNIKFGSISDMVTAPLSEYGLPGISVDFEIYKAGTSTSIATFSGINISQDKTYIGITFGVTNPENFAPNPNGLGTGLGFLINDKVRRAPEISLNTEFFMINAVSDAPALRLKVKDGESLVDSIRFGIHHSNYVSMKPTTHVLEILDSAKDSVLFTYNVDFSPFINKTFVLYATGFLNPDSNQNGAPFTLQAGFQDGTVVVFEPLDPTNIVADNTGFVPEGYELQQNYPNPFNPSTTIGFTLPKAEKVELTIFNVRGQIIATPVNQVVSAGSHQLIWQPNQLPSGVYYYQIKAGNFADRKKMIFLK